MEGNARPRFTPKQKVELWERWRSGQCVADIARALERRNKSGVYRVLALTGGITPATHRRAPLALGLEEREEISRGIAAGRSIRRIGARLGRAPSTVSREVRRNGGCSAYRASEAETRACDRALRLEIFVHRPRLRRRMERVVAAVFHLVEREDPGLDGRRATAMPRSSGTPQPSRQGTSSVMSRNPRISSRLRLSKCPTPRALWYAMKPASRKPSIALYQNY
jgi:hypothetical protein